MQEGDIVLALLPQASRESKLRPAVLLRRFEPHGDFLLCGVSTQLHQTVAGFDELLCEGDLDFAETGLRAASVIRLGFLATQPSRTIRGVLGKIKPERHARLLRRLAQYLTKAL
jgi:mRNA interferase MazF